MGPPRTSCTTFEAWGLYRRGHTYRAPWRPHLVVVGSSGRVPQPRGAQVCLCPGGHRASTPRAQAWSTQAPTSRSPRKALERPRDAIPAVSICGNMGRPYSRQVGCQICIALLDDQLFTKVTNRSGITTYSLSYFGKDARGCTSEVSLYLWDTGNRPQIRKASMSTSLLVFPHQLFEHHLVLRAS